MYNSIYYISILCLMPTWIFTLLLSSSTPTFNCLLYRSKERSRDGDREPSKDRERVDSRDQGRDYDRRSRDRDRHHDRERGHDRERDRDSDRSRGYDSRSRRRSRSRSMERSRDYDRHRYFTLFCSICKGVSTHFDVCFLCIILLLLTSHQESGSKEGFFTCSYACMYFW